MKNLTTLLEEKNIRNAIVIDDVFDEASPANLDPEDWSNFFHDLSDETENLIAHNYPYYSDANRNELEGSHEFVSALWNMRADNALIRRLFQSYLTIRNSELRMLNSLVGQLEALGMDCRKIGTSFELDAADVDLIFVDLFLDSQQPPNGIGPSIEFVRSLIQDRTDSPPLVVLMSRSPFLQGKRDEFREQAGLLASTYRVVPKEDLETNGKLEVILTRLVTRYEDSKRIAAFIDSWKDGLQQAGEAFIKDLRRLDLTDLGQIQALLLEFEGQKLGEYILDVADRVFQHEVEGNERIVQAALNLNQISSGKYLTPHLEGTHDLQDFVYRMMFLHKNRLKFSYDYDKIQLRFGDILRWRSENPANINSTVALVITPTCDLIRDEVEDVLLLFGELKKYGAGSWSYRPKPIRTAIVRPDDNTRNWIEWNLKKVKSFELNYLISLKERDGLNCIGRLREVCALAIQQKFLADFGRVGQPANLPASFQVTVSLFYVDTEGRTRKLIENDIEAVCYSGRDKDAGSVQRLVFTESDCDIIQQKLINLDPEVVHQSARANLRAARTDRELFRRFERGDIEKPGQDKSMKYVKAGQNIYAVVFQDTEFTVGKQITGNNRKVPLLINVSEIIEGG